MHKSKSIFNGDFKKLKNICLINHENTFLKHHSRSLFKKSVCDQ